MTVKQIMNVLSAYVDDTVVVVRNEYKKDSSQLPDWHDTVRIEWVLNSDSDLGELVFIVERKSDCHYKNSNVLEAEECVEDFTVCKCITCTHYRSQS